MEPACISAYMKGKSEVKQREPLFEHVVSPSSTQIIYDELPILA